jgi:FKBP-type peptidyl-prolyl cis-trans isomerase SlyD
MQVTKHTVAFIEYKLTSDEGDVLDTSAGRDPLGYVHGLGTIVPGLERELEGKEKGDTFQVRVEPEHAYGHRDERMVQEVPRSQLPHGDLQVGMQLQAQSEQGSLILTVTKIEGERVLLDANHPLAGIPLNFDVTVVDVREATQEEIEHGHPHGPGGHEH